MHLSSRLDWSAATNPLATALAEARQAPQPLLDLTESNPTCAELAWPADPLEPLGQAATSYTPAPQGSNDARQAIVDYYRRRDVSLSIQDISLTCSTSEAYSHLFQLLADHGETVLVPAPSYPLFTYLARLSGVQLRCYPLGYDGEWYLDVSALREQIDDTVRAIIVVNPNNPTGHYLRESDYLKLSRLSKDLGIPLIVDEVFSDYALTQPATACRTVAGRHDCLSFVLNGVSKVCGLPQMKLGWIAVHGGAAERRQALAGLELIADTYLSVSAPVQAALPAWLGWADAYQTQVQRRLRQNLEVARRLCRDTAIQVLPVEGGWYIVFRLPAIRSDEAWAVHLLQATYVYLLPGYLFDFPGEGYLVGSLLTPPGTFEAGLRHLVASVKSSLDC